MNSNPYKNRRPTRDRRSKAAHAFAVESLECRLNLSTLLVAHAALPIDAGGAAAAPGVAVRYRIDAWSQGEAGGQFGANWINPQFADAQNFFNRFKSRFAPYVAPDPGPSPDPSPTPSPNAVTITQDAMGSLTRLTITGTSGNDSVVVSQSGSTFTIFANGTTTRVTGTFAELAIYGADGNDNITVQSSVNIASLLYGGAGNNTLVAGGSAKSYIVGIGAGTDNVTGNGINTSFWVDPGDTVNASAAEIGNGGVHRVASFYQPFSNTPGNANYISTSLSGQNLPDPTDSGMTTRLTDSLWGTGPTMPDVNQGQVGDCYFLASIQSLALKQPGQLQEMAVDLGDGTYAVEFQRGGTTSYVRVDADMPSASWGGLLYDRPYNGGAMWSAIMEKAYAFFRTGANTYSSLNWGWTGAAFADLGINTTTFNTGNTPSAVFSQIATGLAGGKVEAVISISSPPGNDPVIGSHAYTIVSTSTSSGVQYVTVRNPWGFDGAGNDANPNDGLVKLTLAQFMESFSSGSIAV